MKTYDIFEVFTPAQPAELTYIDRVKISKQLTRALQTPGKQIILYGQSGTGKTTVLKQQLESLKLNQVTTRCMTGMKLSDLVIDAFNQLDSYYVSLEQANTGKKVGGELSASYFGVKASLGAETSGEKVETNKRAVELPITPQTLAKFIGESNACWVIEDFHKMDESEKIKLAQIMKIFMDMANEYKALKIIAIGAVNTAREVVQYDNEMRNRVSEIHLTLMNQEELEAIIEKGEMLLNISISKPIKEKITTYSSGLPSITHQLALYMCQEAKILKTQKTLKNILDKLLDDSVEYYLDENSDTLKSVYDSATKDIKKRKYESPKTILSAILLNKSVNQTPREIALGLKKIYTEYRPNNLKKYLDELTKDDRGEILRYDKNSDTYSFSTPFLRAYAHCMLDKSKTKKIISQAKLLKELKLILRSELERAQERFIIDFSMDRIGYDDLDESSLPNEDMI